MANIYQIRRERNRAGLDNLATMIEGFGGDAADLRAMGNDPQAALNLDVAAVWGRVCELQLGEPTTRTAGESATDKTGAIMEEISTISGIGQAKQDAILEILLKHLK